MTATTTTARIDPQTQEELMRQAGIWIEHSTLIEDDLPARPLAAVQAEKHQLDRYTQLVADRAAARGSKCLAQIEEPEAPAIDADGARYRYLRDTPMSEWPTMLPNTIIYQQSARWDAAIDIAIQATAAATEYLQGSKP